VILARIRCPERGPSTRRYNGGHGPRADEHGRRDPLAVSTSAIDGLTVRTRRRRRRSGCRRVSSPARLGGPKDIVDRSVPLDGWTVGLDAHPAPGSAGRRPELSIGAPCASGGDLRCLDRRTADVLRGSSTAGFQSEAREVQVEPRRTRSFERVAYVYASLPRTQRSLRGDSHTIRSSPIRSFRSAKSERIACDKIFRALRIVNPLINQPNRRLCERLTTCSATSPPAAPRAAPGGPPTRPPARLRAAWPPADAACQLRDAETCGVARDSCRVISPPSRRRPQAPFWPEER
jgi:hypothetical protein